MASLNGSATALETAAGMTPEQKVEWESKGFLVLPDVLEGKELARVREAAARAEARWREDASLPGQRSQVLEQVQAPIEYESELLELLWHPRTLPLVREALGGAASMVDNDFFITPPRTPRTHTGWHHDVGLPGIYHPRSVVMVKLFFLLSDVGEDSGGTAMVPGSHRFPLDWKFPEVDDPSQMPGAVQMLGRAGTAYLFNGRVYHCAVNNASDFERRVLIYNYGHPWMKPWPGYEPSPRLLEQARGQNDPVKAQLLGLSHPYEVAR